VHVVIVYKENVFCLETKNNTFHTAASCKEFFEKKSILYIWSLILQNNLIVNFPCIVCVNKYRVWARNVSDLKPTRNKQLSHLQLKHCVSLTGWVIGWKGASNKLPSDMFAKPADETIRSVKRHSISMTLAALMWRASRKTIELYFKILRTNKRTAQEKFKMFSHYLAEY